MEPGAHRPVHQGVGNRHNGHALMMRHIGPDDDHILAFRHAGRGIIERFVKSIAAQGAHAAQPHHVLAGRTRVNHGRERRGVGRNNSIVTQAALEAKFRHAKI